MCSCCLSPVPRQKLATMAPESIATMFYGLYFARSRVALTQGVEFSGSVIASFTVISNEKIMHFLLQLDHHDSYNPLLVQSGLHEALSSLSATTRGSSLHLQTHQDKGRGRVKSIYQHSTAMQVCNSMHLIKFL